MSAQLKWFTVSRSDGGTIAGPWDTRSEAEEYLQGKLASIIRDMVRDPLCTIEDMVAASTEEFVQARQV